MAEEEKKPLVVIVDQARSNASIRYNPITTVIGIMLIGMSFAFAGCLWIVPIFYVVKTDLLKYWWMPLVPPIVFVTGFLCIFAPDKIISFGGRTLDSVNDRIKNDK